MKLTANELSNFDVGSTHRWSVTLDGIGITGNYSGTYLPATNVEEIMTGIGTQDIELGPATFQIPFSITTPSVSLTFVDNVNYTIHLQIKQWMLDVFAQGRVHFSKKKILNVIKYDHKDVIIFNTTYEVLPSNDIKFLGDPTSQPLTNTLNLMVINKIK